MDTRYAYTDHCTSIIIHLNQSSEVWLFNCSEGTQQNLLKLQIKLALVSKIFITRFTLNNISGLPGLLSTLNLDDRSRALSIYGSREVETYLKFNNKYSQTNYSYPIRIHKLKFHNIFFDIFYTIRMISFEKTDQEIGYIITFRQNLGKFNLSCATTFNIIRGPLYGKLKQHNNFLTPDGHEVQGKQFSGMALKGQKVLIAPNLRDYQLLKELCWQANYLICAY